MARIDNLQNFLTDVAGAIKTKKSYPEETKLAPANFDTEIESISGGELQEKTLTITENQTVELLPDEGYDGMSKVTVEVNIDAVMKTADYEEAKELASDILGEPKVVYGIRRTLNSTGGGWTRTDDAVGMVAKPTYGTTIAQNDFDNAPIYKDIITQDYNISTNTVEAEYGDPDFTFSPSDTNVRVMTYIPEFWAKRWKDSSYEYIQITNRKTDGFIHVPSRRIDRYRNRAKGMAMNASVSRTDARNAKPAPNMALFDVWSWSVLGILYLVEYASYAARTALGYGGTSVTSTETGNHKTGQCDSLGMSSGGTSNDKKHSVIYRGIEDFYGFKREWVDGISWDNDRYIYVCPDYKKYDQAITSDYMRLADKLTSNSVNGYVSRWGYDQNWPLVMTPSGYSFDTNPMYTGLDTRGPMSEGYYPAVTCGANSEYRATILSQSYPVDIDYSYVTHRYVQYDTTAI